MNSVYEKNKQSNNNNNSNTNSSPKYMFKNSLGSHNSKISNIDKNGSLIRSITLNDNSHEKRKSFLLPFKEKDIEILNNNLNNERNNSSRYSNFDRVKTISEIVTNFNNYSTRKIPSNKKRKNKRLLHWIKFDEISTKTNFNNIDSNRSNISNNLSFSPAKIRRNSTFNLGSSEKNNINKKITTSNAANKDKQTFTSNYNQSPSPSNFLKRINTLNYLVSPRKKNKSTTKVDNGSSNKISLVNPTYQTSKLLNKNNNNKNLFRNSSISSKKFNNFKPIGGSKNIGKSQLDLDDDFSQGPQNIEDDETEKDALKIISRKIKWSLYSSLKDFQSIENEGNKEINNKKFQRDSNHTTVGKRFSKSNIIFSAASLKRHINNEKRHGSVKNLRINLDMIKEKEGDSLNDVNSKMDLLSKDNKEIKLEINKSTKTLSPRRDKRGDKYRVLFTKKLIYDSIDDEESFEEVIDDHFYFEPNDGILYILDILTFILSTIYIFYFPIKLASLRCPLNNLTGFPEILFFITDFIFILDVIFSFFRSYYNFEDRLIISKSRIISNYLYGWFLCDLICCIPFNTYFIIHYYDNDLSKCSTNYNYKSNNIHLIFTLFKTIKIFKVRSHKQNLISDGISKFFMRNLSFYESYSSAMSYLFGSVFALNIGVCIFIFVARNYYPNYIVYKHSGDKKFSDIYVITLYYILATVTTVGYGDVSPVSIVEKSIAMILLALGIIAYSFTVSKIANIIKVSNKKKEKFEEKLRMLEEIKFAHPEVNHELYFRIYRHLEYSNNRGKQDYNFLLDSLPSTIKNMLLYQMYSPIIKNLKFFRYFSNMEFIDKVAANLIPVLAFKNDVLIQQGEIIEDMIFVKDGRLSLEILFNSKTLKESVTQYLNFKFFDNWTEDESEIKDIETTQVKLSNMSTNEHHLNAEAKANMYSNTLARLSSDANVTKVKTGLRSRTSLARRSSLMSSLILTARNSKKVRYKHLKVLDIRKNEHFGGLLMFLGDPCPLSLIVTSKKAELFFLRKIDAMEISSGYKNIWKRSNKTDFHNMWQIKLLAFKIIKRYCDKHNIPYQKDELNEIKKNMSKFAKQKNETSDSSSENNDIVNNINCINKDNNENKDSSLLGSDNVSKFKISNESEKKLNNKSENKLFAFNSNKDDVNYQNTLPRPSAKFNEFRKSIGKEFNSTMNINDLSRTVSFIKDNNNDNLDETIKINNSNIRDKVAKLIGTPFMPYDINDEIYQNEKFDVSTCDNICDLNNKVFQDDNFKCRVFGSEGETLNERNNNKFINTQQSYLSKIEATNSNDLLAITKFCEKREKSANLIKKLAKNENSDGSVIKFNNVGRSGKFNRTASIYRFCELNVLNSKPNLTPNNSKLVSQNKLKKFTNTSLKYDNTEINQTKITKISKISDISLKINDYTNLSNFQSIVKSPHNKIRSKNSDMPYISKKETSGKLLKDYKKTYSIRSLSLLNSHYKNKTFTSIKNSKRTKETKLTNNTKITKVSNLFKNSIKGSAYGSLGHIVSSVSEENDKDNDKTINENKGKLNETENIKSLNFKDDRTSSESSSSFEKSDSFYNLNKYKDAKKFDYNYLEISEESTLELNSSYENINKVSEGLFMNNKEFRENILKEVKIRSCKLLKKRLSHVEFRVSEGLNKKKNEINIFKKKTPSVEEDDKLSKRKTKNSPTRRRSVFEQKSMNALKNVNKSIQESNATLEDPNKYFSSLFANVLSRKKSMKMLKNSSNIDKKNPLIKLLSGNIEKNIKSGGRKSVINLKNIVFKANINAENYINQMAANTNIKVNKMAK